MQSLFLRPAVHLASVGDDVVSLDVQSGDYSCLPGVGGFVPRPGPDGRLDLAVGEIADLLLETGLAVREAAAGVRTDLPPRASASFWRTERASITLADQRRFARACLSATPQFWRAPFGALMAIVQRGRLARADGSMSALERDAQVFDQLAPFAPFQGECLFRAFLLLAYLRLERRDATWVFGVRTYPFQAHCWLQVGDTVINDAVERICGYTPILAV